jgi:NAD(P)-dependent dehydrogenase (short-subunit alcohol dehydrogenase family)
VALITGGCSGIGAALGTRLATDGWTVIATARGTPGDTDDADTRVAVIGCDVRDDASVEAAVRTVVDRYGRLDLLVAGAATARFGSLADIGIADLAAVLDTNYLGVARCCRAVLPVMTARRAGSIVVFSSGWALMSPPGTGAYAASKAAVATFAETLSYEAAGYGIDVHVVYPGYVPGTRLVGHAVRAGMRRPSRRLTRDRHAVAARVVRCVGRAHPFEVFMNPIERYSGVVRAALPRVYRRAARAYRPFPETQREWT